ncbi:uncharacterized protein BJX67DRAFT_344501 [Aspergillus lucknowensis]|uniref:NF-X1-type domain-containing protein n=1 Tax=Aspergillus lucknowensis TaxID=176173 RepID=A0ABR4M2A4_9EURO
MPKASGNPNNAGCAHEVIEFCHSDVSISSYRCKSPCGAELQCGHTCKRKCFECNRGGTIGHGSCQQQCGRNYSTCTHVCTSLCHGTNPCPPCQAVCKVRCNHSKCTRKCWEPCVPCAEERCPSSCPHSVCTMPCAAPCNHVPCSLRCEKYLPCGHRCPSVCGEDCPSISLCQTCSTENIQNHPVDFILGQKYKDLNLGKYPCIFPRCGHFLTMESMDAQMDIGKYYELDDEGKPKAIKDSAQPFRMEDIKACVLCRGLLRDISRYGRPVRQGLLDESTKKLILYLNREYMPLAQNTARNIQLLQD